jgi:excisionase family DNA binding protein
LFDSALFSATEQQIGEAMLAVQTENQTKLLYGRSQAAGLLDISARTLDDAIRDGSIEALRIGRRVLISRDALLKFIELRRHDNTTSAAYGG